MRNDNVGNVIVRNCQKGCEISIRNEMENMSHVSLKYKKLKLIYCRTSYTYYDIRQLVRVWICRKKEMET